jgi:hypothetical protein
MYPVNCVTYLPGPYRRAPNQRMELAGAMLQRNIGWRRLRGWRPQLMRGR